MSSVQQIFHGQAEAHRRRDQSAFVREQSAACAATGHVSTSTGAARFRTSHHGRCCEANQATAAVIVASGLSTHFPPENYLDVMAPALARLANLSVSTDMFPITL